MLQVKRRDTQQTKIDHYNKKKLSIQVQIQQIKKNRNSNHLITNRGVIVKTNKKMKTFLNLIKLIKIVTIII